MTTNFSRRPGRTGRVSAAAAFLALCLLLPVPWRAVRTFAQTFRSEIDLIAVDVQVLDKRGQPVTALTPDKFNVTLDGARRRVVSANLVRFDVAPMSATPAATPPVDAVSSPLPPLSAHGPTGTGRTFIIAVDTSSFRSTDVNMARLAADRFTRGLLPEDAVGVFTLPTGPYLDPTTSHAAARQMIAKIPGRKIAAPSQLDMSIEQVIDITAIASTQPILVAQNSVIDEAASSDTTPIDCPGTKIACTQAAIAEASGLATALEEDVFQGIEGLGLLLRRLQASPERKTVILFSAGMPVADRSGGRPSMAREVRLLGEQAAYANATIHTVYFDANLINEFSVDSRRPKSSTVRTRVINTRALAEFTEPSGGALMEVGLGPADDEIDTLLKDISTYYVLGVEPDAADRDGRPHRLQVKVAERNAQLHNRELVIVPKSK